MAHQVADYVVLRDSGKKLQVGSDIDWQRDFDLPDAARLDQRMFLQWFYTTGTDANLLKYRWRINGTNIRTITNTGNHFGSLHEVLGGSNLKVSDNTIEVAITGGSGSVTVSDVMLHFQRNI